jgi:hypothetical protein
MGNSRYPKSLIHLETKGPGGVCLDLQVDSTLMIEVTTNYFSYDEVLTEEQTRSLYLAMKKHYEGDDE